MPGKHKFAAYVVGGTPFCEYCGLSRNDSLDENHKLLPCEGLNDETGKY